MLKKSRLAALFLACAVGVVSAVPAFAEEAAVQDEAAPYYTHELPGSVKIGELLYDDFPTEGRYPITIHNLIPGKFCGVSYNTSFTFIGSTEATSSIYNNHVIFADHSAGYYNIREIPESGDFSCESPTSAMVSFITPGTFCIDVGYRYYEKTGNLLDGINPISDRQAVGEPIIIEVEAPVIETNAPKSIEVGNTLQFTTELTNTALSNRDVAPYLDESNYNDNGFFIGETGDASPFHSPSHTPAFQPSVEIIEGQDLVKQSNQDYTNTLKSSEELTFTGRGTVKLKVTYNQFVTCPSCQGSDGEGVYNPEEMITIEVTDGSSEPSEPSEPSEDEVKYETAEGVKIEGDGLFPDGTVVKAEAVTTGGMFDTAKTALSNIAEKISVFDVSAFNGETAVQPNGNVKVTFDVPDDFSDNVSLYYVSDSGETEKIESAFNKETRTLTAELKHFSVYVLADEETKPADNTTDEGTKPADGNPGTGVVTSLYPLFAVVGVSGVVFAVMRKKRS